MIRESIVGPDGGEVVRLGPATVRILEDGSTTGHRLGIGEITVAPHSSGPPQHRHARHDEWFYVVSGTARFTGDAGPRGHTSTIRSLLSLGKSSLFMRVDLYYESSSSSIAGDSSLLRRSRNR